MAMLCIWPDPRPTGAAAAHDAVTPSSRWSCAVVGLAARHDHRWHRGGTCSDALNLPLANGESPQTPSASGGPGRAVHCSLMDALPCPALAAAAAATVATCKQAYGADPVIESVLVKFTSGPNEAWGEACTLGAPTYSPEHAAGIFCVLKEHFVDLVIGKEFDTSDDLQHALRWFKGNQFAKVVLPAATAAAAIAHCCVQLPRRYSLALVLAAGCAGHGVVGPAQRRTRLSTARPFCRGLWSTSG